MKNILLASLFLLIGLNCATQNKTVNNKEETSIKPTKNEDGKWELTVIDTQYNYFLNAIAKPKSLYTENYLKSRNTLLVTEWNSYYFSGRYRNVIESSIDYDRNENYGLDFEYRLYQVFAYVQWKYSLKMNGLSAADIR